MEQEEAKKIPEPTPPDYDAFVLPEKRVKEIKGVI